jgi:hypothetical protein
LQQISPYYQAMALNGAIFVLTFMLSAALVAAAGFMTWRLLILIGVKDPRNWLTRWCIKGLALPLLVWALMNFGLSFSLQPFMPSIQAAQNRGAQWFPLFLRVVGTGWAVISSIWASVTMAWILARASAGLDEERLTGFRGLCFACACGMLIPGAMLLWLCGSSGIGFAAFGMLAAIAGYAPGLLNLQKTPPMYARAVAKLKFGKYAEAEAEIIHQLEKCEDDFQGWLMMAELYALHFHDLNEAEQTVLEICDQPSATPSQISVALQKLADWHLNPGDNPEAARRALEMICNRLKGSHLAHMAQLRINQMPENAAELHELRHARPIPLPALGDSFDPGPDQPISFAQKAEATELANACVDRLTHDPNNVAAREKLARLLTERLHQPERGLEQLTLLLNMPDQPDLKRAEWLGLVAAWQIRHLHNQETGRKIMERIIHEFPNSPQAMAARRRLKVLENEYRG